MQTKRVLVGVDFSAPSVEAARWVARHLAPDADVVLAHVISLPESRADAHASAHHDALVETLRVGATTRLQDVTLDTPVDRVRLEVREGPPADTLARLAEQMPADLIVVGRTGDTPDGRKGLGSTAERLVHISHVPVLVSARPRSATPANIFVAVDESHVADTALAWAAVLCRAFGARVTTIHVVSSAVSSGALTAAAVLSGTPPPDPRVPLTPVRPTNEWAERAVKAGVPSERVESVTEFGDPAHEIVSAAERAGADLLVMGRRGAGNIRRAVLGSTVDAVLRRAPCPVLVVPD
jgi:nucleotide-binding universal stress UspA family protein